MSTNLIETIHQKRRKFSRLFISKFHSARIYAYKFRSESFWKFVWQIWVATKEGRRRFLEHCAILSAIRKLCRPQSGPASANHVPGWQSLLKVAFVERATSKLLNHRELQTHLKVRMDKTLAINKLCSDSKNGCNFCLSNFFVITDLTGQILCHISFLAIGWP